MCGKKKHKCTGHDIECMMTTALHQKDCNTAETKNKSAASLSILPARSALRAAIRSGQTFAQLVEHCDTLVLRAVCSLPHERWIEKKHLQCAALGCGKQFSSLSEAFTINASITGSHNGATKTLLLFVCSIGDCHDKAVAEIGKYMRGAAAVAENIAAPVYGKAWEDRLPRLSERVCAYCDSKDKRVMRCKGCRIVCYCSEKCQRAHWKAHKIQCRSLRNVQALAFNSTPSSIVSELD